MQLCYRFTKKGQLTFVVNETLFENIFDMYLKRIGLGLHKMNTLTIAYFVF